MRRSLKVGQHPDPIANLVHNVSFATDEQINTMIERRYRLYEWLTPNDYANQMMLQSVIDQWAAYCDKIYATTQYEYNPILNYDRHEEGAEITGRHKGSKRSMNTDIKAETNSDVTETTTPRVERVTENYSFGMGSDPGGSLSGKSVEVEPTGTEEVKTSGTAANNYVQTSGTAANNYERYEDIDANTYDKDVLEFEDRRTYGNIGTMTTQQMIREERDITIDVLAMYVEKFGECFDLSRDIICGWLSNEDGEPDWDYPEDDGEGGDG